MKRKLSVMLALLVVLSMVWTTGAAAVEGPVDDNPLTAQNVPAYSNRLIVRLEAPSLVEYANSSAAKGLELKRADGQLNVDSPAATSYIAELQAQQAAFLAQLQAVLPDAQPAAYVDSAGNFIPLASQVAMNATVVEVSAVTPATIKRISAMEGVRQVFRDYRQEPAMYASLPLINAPAMWDMLGGQDSSGEGVIVGIIDSGVYAPNPFFDPAGYSYPPGYPVGDTRFTTEKVIGARAYFRPWDPPTAGDEGAWPGVAGSSHGTHVAGTTAGNANTLAVVANLTEVISGVAPRAQIIGYRIFYPSSSQFSGSAFDAEIVMAYEGAIRDGVDVINYSAGGYSGVNPIDSATALAREAAWDAGIFVSHSAGNSGPGSSTTWDSSPKIMEVAASSTSGTLSAGTVGVVAPEPVPDELRDMPFGSCSFCPTPFGQIVGPAVYTDVGTITAEGTKTLCDNEEIVGDLTDQIALISRGGCFFSDKVYNAQQAGAIAAIVYNNQGDGLLNMSAGSHEGEVFIPGAFIGQTNGEGMFQFADANPGAEAQFDFTFEQVGNTPDVLAGFSSRGPAFARYLEPDVTAPGVNILSAGYAVGATGVDRHAGFGQISGTSMAAPHVAGSAALLKQMHPDWTPTQIMSALMSTSVTEVWLDNALTMPATVLDMGAGRIDLGKAGDPGLVFDSPSVSFGAHKAGAMATMTVTATDIRSAGGERVYDVSVMADASITASVSPSSLTFMGGESHSFDVMVDTTGAEPGDYGGMIYVSHGPHVNHLPLWVRVEAPASDATVLLIDNDFSDLLGYPDYTYFYTSTLETLGVSYDYYNADLRFNNPQTLPSAYELAAYDAIIYWSGDNYQSNGAFSVATPLTDIDLQILTDWQFDGGRLLVTGQDMLSAWDALDTTGNGYFFTANLGAGYLQDSIFDPGYTGNLPPVPAVIGQPGSPLSGLVLDISGSAPITDVVDDEVVIVGWEDGAANQYFVDEVGLAPFGDLGASDAVAPILAAIDGSPVGAGYVGVARADSPILERPYNRFDYRTIYLSFGFEGINNNTGYNTREAVAAAALAWLTDEVDVTVSGPALVTHPYDLATFNATMTSSVGGSLVGCRWDFGDGSDFAEGGATAGYIYGAEGTFTVRVECRDSLGFSDIAETTVTVTEEVVEPEIPRSQRFNLMMDAFIDGTRPATNFGDASTIWAGFYDNMRPVVMAPISGIPNDAEVDKAYLYLYVVDGRGFTEWANSVINISAHGVSTEWDEDTATWQVPWEMVGGDFGPAVDTNHVGSGKLNTWLRLDVTDAVADMVQSGENYGFILTSDDSGGVRYGFAGQNYWDSSKAGYMRVMYRTFTGLD